MGTKKIVINTKKCISCGACVSIAPESFSLDESNIDAVSVPINPPKNSPEDLKLAIQSCPTKAISLV